jgi:type II secretory pathway pseudopilin PulG
MIELIFVIVIIGILAAVAIPKLASTQKSAKASTVEAFVGTMNRSVLPSMYAKAIRTNGEIKGYAIAEYVDVPSEMQTVSLSACGAASWGLAATTKLGIKIYCRDGNLTHPPKFSFTDDGNTTLADTWFE